MNYMYYYEYKTTLDSNPETITTYYKYSRAIQFTPTIPAGETLIAGSVVAIDRLLLPQTMVYDSKFLGSSIIDHSAWVSGAIIESISYIDYEDDRFIQEFQLVTNGNHDDFALVSIHTCYENQQNEDVVVKTIVDEWKVPAGLKETHVYPNTLSVSKSGSTNLYLKITVKSYSTTAFRWSANIQSSA